MKSQLSEFAKIAAGPWETDVTYIHGIASVYIKAAGAFTYILSGNNFVVYLGICFWENNVWKRNSRLVIKYFSYRYLFSFFFYVFIVVQKIVYSVA